MKVLRKLNAITAKIEEFVLGFGVLGMSIVLIGNVIMRMMFNNSFKFAEELGQILLISVTFIGISYVTRHGKHVRMSVLYDIVPHKIKKIFALIISGVTSATMFCLSFLSYNYMLGVYATKRITPALRMPMYLVILVVFIGFLFTAFQFLTIFCLNIKNNDVYIGTIVGVGEEKYE
ncbi:TRAP transporter small permease [Wukongibacter baidiensis]|uniref:TRAP transporter small permease n=1 Tax=Wukongibacter baidiensis TaxID=1723361 RepID=UPI003D7F6931